MDISAQVRTSTNTSCQCIVSYLHTLSIRPIYTFRYAVLLLLLRCTMLQSLTLTLILTLTRTIAIATAVAAATLHHATESNPNPNPNPYCCCRDEYCRRVRHARRRRTQLDSDLTGRRCQI